MNPAVRNELVYHLLRGVGLVPRGEVPGAVNPEEGEPAAVAHLGGLALSAGLAVGKHELLIGGVVERLGGGVGGRGGERGVRV